MSRHSDFFMHYEDSSCPLNDLFPQLDSQEWHAKAPEKIPSPRAKAEGNIKDLSSVTDSLIDINLFDPIKNSSTSSMKTFTGINSVFSSFPDSSLSSDSNEVKAQDELSEQTDFSGHLSETRNAKVELVPSPSQPYHRGVAKTKASVVNIGQISDRDSNESLKFLYKNPGICREVQKPPTTKDITLEHLKAVFHLERPKAEKKLNLKRTTFSNLSRHYGISKWPFRTIRDALNRMEANKTLLENANVSKERRRKLMRQQKLLHDVIDLIYKEPRHSRDSNTLAVLLMIVAAKDNQ